MKKLVALCCLIFVSSTNIQAIERDEVSLSRCIDGDTAAFLINNKEEKVRFLAIDAPEYTNKKEPYGKEASEYACSLLNSAQHIYLEYEDSNSYDKYNRRLAWVFVDDTLLQELLVKQGLAEVKYIYGDYEYTDLLYAKEKDAKQEKLNIWNDYEEDKFYYIIALGFIVAIIFVFLFKKKAKKQTLRKLKKGLRNHLK